MAIKFLQTSNFWNMKPEKILGKKFVRGKPYYKIKWDKAPKEQATWEAPPDLLKYKNLINKYEVKHWGANLDEKFFDPENYLTKGFPKKKLDKKQAKEEKRKEKKKQGSRDKHSNREESFPKIKVAKKHEESEEEYSGTSGSDSYSEEESRYTNSKASESSNQEQSESQQIKKKSKKHKKKNKGKKKKEPSICILDSQTQEPQVNNPLQIPQQPSDDEQSMKSQKKSKSKKASQDKKQQKNGDTQEQQSNKPQLTTEKSSDLVEIIIPKPYASNEQKQISKETQKQRSTQKNVGLPSVAILQSSEIANIDIQRKEKSRWMNRFDAEIEKPEKSEDKKHAEKTPDELITASKASSRKKTQNFKAVQEINYLITPMPAPKLVRMYHLQKISQMSHLYLVEYSNGDMIKMNTNQMIETHSEELVSFLEKKNKMRCLGI